MYTITKRNLEHSACTCVDKVPDTGLVIGSPEFRALTYWEQLALCMYGGLPPFCISYFMEGLLERHPDCREEYLFQEFRCKIRRGLSAEAGVCAYYCALKVVHLLEDPGAEMVAQLSDLECSVQVGERRLYQSWKNKKSRG